MPVGQALALKHKDTLMMGRSHGIHAEPITFGFKVAGWYTETEAGPGPAGGGAGGDFLRQAFRRGGHLRPQRSRR